MIIASFNLLTKLALLLFAMWISIHFYGKFEIKQIGFRKLVAFGIFCIFFGLILNFLVSDWSIWNINFWTTGFIEDDLILFVIAFGFGLTTKCFLLKSRS